MSLLAFRPAVAAAAAACLSLTASPVLAASASMSLPRGASVPAAALPGDVARDRGGWGGGGWGGGWNRGRGHHDGVDAGDIFAGVLVLGTIAAIASAASKSKKEKEAEVYRYPGDSGSYNGADNGRRYGDDGQSRSGSSSSDWGRSRSIDGAVDTCIAEIERGSARVDTVDGVDREGQGWRIEGRTRGGSPFSCAVDGEGRVRTVSIDGKAR